MKYVLAVDFDGVIHRYSRGDQGMDIYDPPTVGAQEHLAHYLQAFDVHILSARAATAAGRHRITAWLKRYGFPEMPCSNQKPSGELLAYLDDRAWLFRGSFPTVNELLAFRPWWQDLTIPREEVP